MFVCVFQSEDASIFQCPEQTPFGQSIKRVNRVFVVAQVDDSYIYHIHLGMKSVYSKIAKPYFLRIRLIDAVFTADGIVEYIY